MGSVRNQAVREELNMFHDIIKMADHQMIVSTCRRNEKYRYP